MVVWARRRLRELDMEPPLCLEALRSALERDRQLDITLTPTDELPPGSAFGVTGIEGGIAVVLYEARTTRSHQTVIILHEFSHMLLYHPPSEVLHTQSEIATFREIDAAAVVEAIGASLPSHAFTTPNRVNDSVIDTADSNLYVRVCEREAEMLATILLGWVSGQSGYIPGRTQLGLDEYLGDRGAW